MVLSPGFGKDNFLPTKICYWQYFSEVRVISVRSIEANCLAFPSSAMCPDSFVQHVLRDVQAPTRVLRHQRQGFGNTWRLVSQRGGHPRRYREGEKMIN